MVVWLRSFSTMEFYHLSVCVCAVQWGVGLQMVLWSANSPHYFPILTVGRKLPTSETSTFLPISLPLSASFPPSSVFYLSLLSLWGREWCDLSRGTVTREMCVQGRRRHVCVMLSWESFILKVGLVRVSSWSMKPSHASLFEYIQEVRLLRESMVMDRDSLLENLWFNVTVETRLVTSDLYQARHSLANRQNIRTWEQFTACEDGS